MSFTIRDYSNIIPQPCKTLDIADTTYITDTAVTVDIFVCISLKYLLTGRISKYGSQDILQIPHCLLYVTELYSTLL